MLTKRPDLTTILLVLLLFVSIDLFVAFILTCPPSEPQQAAKCSGEYYGLHQMMTYRILAWINHYDALIAAAATIAIAYFTFTLKKSTDKLWAATTNAANTQASDTRIIQRAYVSVNLGGIDTNSDGQLLGYVVFENAGHLPASDFFGE